MKKFVDIAHISQHVGEEISVRGWVYNRTPKGKLVFLIIRDGTGFMQAIVTENDVPEATFALAERLKQETSLILTGKIRADKRAPGGYEMDVKSIEVIHEPIEDYPISLKPHGIDFLLSHRHLHLRSRRPFAIMRIRHTVVTAIREFFDSRGFLLLDAPILTPTACEGTTTLFEVPYFHTKAYLSQSGQLYAEAGAMAFGKVYTFGPTFRAEKSKTRRHLTEFWQIEPEVAFATLDDIMELAEDLIVHIVERVLTKCQKELTLLERNIKPLEDIKKPFPRISYTEAVNLIQKKFTDFTWGNDFGAPHETYLSQQFTRPVIVHRYPAKVKAFYMKRDPDNPELALAMDVLAPEGYGEIIGGSERESDYETLIQRLKEFNLPREPFEWYLDLRKYGSVPHSGFGLGLERTLAWICGLHHVRETIPFPRTIDRIYP